MRSKLPADERKSVFGNRPGSSSGGVGAADWAAASATVLGELIQSVTAKGGAIRFGFTRDGGAYSVGFYYGDDRTTEYCRPSEDLDEFLEKWIEFYKGLPILKK